MLKLVTPKFSATICSMIKAQIHGFPSLERQQITCLTKLRSPKVSCQEVSISSESEHSTYMVGLMLGVSLTLRLKQLKSQSRCSPSSWSTSMRTLTSRERSRSLGPRPTPTLKLSQVTRSRFMDTLAL